MHGVATLRAVLFDFGDTLFGRTGAHRAIVQAAAELGEPVDEPTARALWAEIQARARTPEELAKGRDLSPDAHRACWTALYSRLDEVVAGLGKALYEREIDPLGWEPFPDSELVDVFALSCEHGVTKPAPPLFEAACAGLGVAPAQTLVVGDNPLTDGRAVDCGLTAYLLPPALDSTPRGLGAVLALMGASS